MFKRLMVLLVVFSLVGTQNVYALRPNATAESPVAEEIDGDLGDGGKGGQRTWITGPYTPSQVLDAAAATQADLEQAGSEKRIFAVLGDGAKDLAQQVRQYAAERTSPARQLPFLEDKEQKKLVERLQKAAEFHRKALEEFIGETKKQLLENVRHAIVYDEGENPFFYVEVLGKGDFVGVTTSSGTYQYDGFRGSLRHRDGKRPQTIYIKLALIEAYMAMAQDPEAEKWSTIRNSDGYPGMVSGTIAEAAYRSQIYHEMNELQSDSKRHIEEPDDVKKQVESYSTRIYTAWKNKQADARKKKEAKERGKVIAEVTSANLGRFFDDGVISEDIVKAVEAGLARLVEQDILIDYKVFANQEDLHIYTTRGNEMLNKDGPFVVKNIIDIIVKALSNEEVSKMDFRDQVKALEIRRTFKPLKFTERAAEPIAVISASNTYVGAFNLFLWRVLCDPMTVAGLTIDPTGDRGFMVEVWDSLENKTYIFDSITENKELRVLISEPGRYAIVAAYPKKEHKISSDEPIVAVSVKRIFDDGKTPVGDHSPVVIVRSQSGLPAWGEVIEGFAKGQPIVTYGGDKTRHMVAWKPVHIEEARKTKRGRTQSILTGFGYQSNGNGRIGEAEDVGGDKTLDVTREQADKWDGLLRDIPDELWDIIKNIEPFLRPYAYDRDDVIGALKEQWESGELLDGFERNPDPKKGETDPLLADSLDITVSTIKVDIGSRPGHFKPHSFTMQGAGDVMEIAKRFGRARALEYISQANILKVQMVKEHLARRKIQRKIQKGRINWQDVTKALNSLLEKAWGKDRAAEIKALGIARLDVDGLISLLEERQDVAKVIVTELARQTYMDADKWAAGLHRLASDVLDEKAPTESVEDILDYKVWHAGDDIQLTIAHRKGVEASDIHTLAFETFIYAAEVAGPAKVYGYKQDILVNELVSGNVQGAGPGYAEIPLREGDSVVNLSADKTAPGAFTVPFLYWVQKAVKDGRFPNGVIAEVWAIEGHQRTFIDLSNKADFQIALKLLRAPELFAIKRVWSVKEKWDHGKTVSEVLDRVIASASTERLVLVAGEYVGKDDPTMYILVGDNGFSEDDIINFWQHPQFALGFMRGSHMGPIMPDENGKALPHRFDGPPPLCGWIFKDVGKGELALENAVDAFKNRSWLKWAHKITNFFTDVLRALGFMPPHKVEGPDTEYTTAPKVRAALDARGMAVDAGNAEEDMFQEAVPGVLQQKAGLTIEAASQVGSEILAQDAVEKEISQLTPVPEVTYGLILSRELVFEEGLGVILPGLARNLAGKARVAVVVSTPAENAIIAKLNEGLSDDFKIITHPEVDSLARTLKDSYKVALVKYLIAEAVEGLSFANVDEVVVIKNILKAIGKIEPLLSNPDAVEEFKWAVIIRQQA